LKNGANVNARDKWGQTPLYFAQTVPVVKALLQAGAKVNISSYNGNTPLHMVAVRCLPLEAVPLLLERGASPIAQNNARETPVHIAAANGRCTDTLQALLSGDGKKALSMQTNWFLTPAILARGENNKRIIREAIEDQMWASRLQQEQDHLKTKKTIQLQLKPAKTNG
jgi:ankyrin repeat protein